MGLSEGLTLSDKCQAHKTRANTVHIDLCIFSLMSLCSYRLGFAPFCLTSLSASPCPAPGSCPGWISGFRGSCSHPAFCNSKPQPSSAWWSQARDPETLWPQGLPPSCPPQLRPLPPVIQTDSRAVSTVWLHPGAPALPKWGFSSDRALNQPGNQNLLENRMCSHRAEIEMMPVCKLFKIRLHLGKAHGQNNKETAQKATDIHEK